MLKLYAIIVSGSITRLLCTPIKCLLLNKLFIITPPSLESYTPRNMHCTRQTPLVCYLFVAK